MKPTHWWPQRIPFSFSAGVFSLSIGVVPFTAEGSDYVGGYQFAPRNGSPSTGPYGQPDINPGWAPDIPMVSPSGQTYRFRDEPEFREETAGPRFRPDSRLKQVPRNWRPDASWTTDPVLRRGMVFRPLENKPEKQIDAAPPPEPLSVPFPGYGYPWSGTLDPGYYAPGATVPWVGAPGLLPPPISLPPAW